jgi:hypothetical protein
MRLVHVRGEIPFVADRMSQYRRCQIPRSLRRVMTGDLGSPFGKDFAKAILMARQRPGKSASPGGRSLPRRRSL